MNLNAIDDRTLKRSLDLNIIAASLGTVFFTVFGIPVGSPLFTGFMRSLGAGDFIYSIVMALPVLGAASQVVGSYFLETTGKRRFVFLASGFAHRLLWIPVALIPLFVNPNRHEAIIWSITILITLSSIANSLCTVAFNSWMGDLVPKEIIGRFFSKRALMSTIAGAVAGLALSVFIDRVNNFNGFAILFILGAMFGVADISVFSRIHHPQLQLHEKKPTLLSTLIDPFKNKEYVLFALFATVFAFGVNFSAPFINVYMIENLRMNYLMITLSTQIMVGVSTILFVRKWGSLADRYGNRFVLIVNAVGIAVVPAVWAFTTPGNYLLVFILNFFAGVFWSGYNIAIFNQSVWLAPNQNRSAYIACFSLLTSVFGTAVAYLCGGIFMQYARPFFNSTHIPFIAGTTLNAYNVLFLISALMRVVAVLFVLPLVREEKMESTRLILGQIVRGYGLQYRRFLLRILFLVKK